MAFKYLRKITVHHELVPSTLLNFPLCVCLQDIPELGYVGLFGDGSNAHVENANGYDIGFFSDAALTTPMNWEVEYFGGFGGFTAWVRIPSLSHTADTIFYMAYGDASITTDQSTPVSVWANYRFVLHLSEDSGTNLDSSIGTIDFTKGASGQPAYTFFGKPTEGQDFERSTTDVCTSAVDSLDPTVYTMSCWVKLETLGGPIITRTDSSGTGTTWTHQLKTNASTGKAEAYIYDGAAKTATSDTVLVPGRWYHLAATAVNSGNLTLFVNGVAEDSVAIGTLSTAGDRWTLGGTSGGVTGAFDGVIDEVRYLAVDAFSADWFRTEYLNIFDLDGTGDGKDYLVTVGDEIPVAISQCKLATEVISENYSSSVTTLMPIAVLIDENFTNSTPTCP